MNRAVVRDKIHVDCLGADDAYLLDLWGYVEPSHVDTVVTIDTVKVRRRLADVLSFLEPQKAIFVSVNSAMVQVAKQDYKRWTR